MTDPDFESRIEAALRERARAVDPRRRVDELFSPTAEPSVIRPRRRRLLAAAAVVVGAAAAVVLWPESDPVRNVETVNGREAIGDVVSDPPAAPGFDGDIVIWLDPDITIEEIGAIENDLDERSEVESWRFSDQAETYLRITQLYSDLPQVLAVVTAEDLPPSFRLTLAPDTNNDRIAEIANAFEKMPGVRATVLPPATPFSPAQEAPAAVPLNDLHIVSYYLLRQPADGDQRTIEELVRPVLGSVRLVDLLRPMFQPDFATAQGEEGLINLLPEFVLEGIVVPAGSSTATVTLSFEGEAPANDILRDAAAQLVYTLTSFPQVDSIQVKIGSEIVALPTTNDEQSIVTRPVDTDDYLKYSPDFVP